MFLVLSVLGILSFVPNFGNTGYLWVMDEAVDEANKYCAGEVHLGYGIPVGGLKTCPQACECDGKPCDFDELSTLWEAEAGFGFALLVLTILTYAVAFTGALQESPALLKPFVYIMPALMGLGLITGILAAVADTTIWKAWVMYDNPPYDWQCGWAFDFPPQVFSFMDQAGSEAWWSTQRTSRRQFVPRPSSPCGAALRSHRHPTPRCVKRKPVFVRRAARDRCQ